MSDVPFDPSQLIYRDQGYGSSPGKPLFDFALDVTNEEPLALFSKPFEDFVDVCKEDDKRGEADIPELKQLGYPSLGQMLVLHRLVLSELLKNFLYFQLLDALLGKNLRSSWRFAVNEISKVSDQKTSYLIGGSGYYL